MSPARCRFLRTLLVVILAAGLDRTVALARDTDKSWELGAYLSMTRYAAGTRMDNSNGFGLRGGYHFKAVNELEGSLDLQSANDSKLKGVSYDITKISVDYVRNFLIKGHEKITPFATFGAGLIGFDNGDDNGTSSAYRVGGGFKYFFKPRVGFRFDVKLYRWHGDGTVLVRDPFFSADATFAVTFLVGGGK